MNDYNNKVTAEHKDYDDKDGIYVEVYAVKDGVKYVLRRTAAKEFTNSLVNGLLNGFESFCTGDLQRSTLS